jgi:hypothetical protein
MAPSVNGYPKTTKERQNKAHKSARELAGPTGGSFVAFLALRVRAGVVFGKDG